MPGCSASSTRSVRETTVAAARTMEGVRRKKRTPISESELLDALRAARERREATAKRELEELLEERETRVPLTLRQRERRGLERNLRGRTWRRDDGHAA
jgi:predicted DNA binding protein